MNTLSANYVPNRADVVIVTPLEEERDAVLNHLPGYRRIVPSGAETRVYYWADVTGCRVVVLPLLGMGRVQGAVATDAAIARWQPQYVILVGIAGGVASYGVKLGDVLVADQIVDYELQKIRPEGPEIRWQVYQTDSRLLGVALNLRDDEWHELIVMKRPGGRGMPKRYRGPIASGDKVIAFKETLAQYQEIWSKLVGVEMEAGGVAISALQADSRPRFFMVRGVSDLADDKKDSASVGRWRPYACDVAAAYTMALLKTAPLNNSRHSASTATTTPTQAASAVSEQPFASPADYNRDNIRRLLIEGFTDQELKRFCFDTPDFRPVYQELGHYSGKSEVVDRILEYAERVLKVDQLLQWAKAKNPARYKLHEPYR